MSYGKILCVPFNILSSVKKNSNVFDFVINFTHEVENMYISFIAFINS